MTRQELPLVQLFCDGSCSLYGTRANHGGWCAILRYGSLEKTCSGHSYPETNSTMELMGLIGGLRELTIPCRVEFYCDAQYVVKGVNEWLDKWIARKWKKVAHVDMWTEIDNFRKIHQIHGNWIRGHSKENNRSAFQEYNVLCDELAEQEAWVSYWRSMEKSA